MCVCACVCVHSLPSLFTCEQEGEEGAMECHSFKNFLVGIIWHRLFCLSGD